MFRQRRHLQRRIRRVILHRMRSLFHGKRFRRWLLPNPQKTNRKPKRRNLFLQTFKISKTSLKILQRQPNFPLSKTQIKRNYQQSKRRSSRFKHIKKFIRLGSPTSIRQIPRSIRMVRRTLQLLLSNKRKRERRFLANRPPHRRQRYLLVPHGILASLLNVRRNRVTKTGIRTRLVDTR